jgi:hypothetical protein
MNNVSDNKSAGHEVYKDNYKSKDETCKSIVYRKYRHIRFTFISVPYSMVDCPSKGEE